MPHFPTQIDYSEKYQDTAYEYRHVILTKELFNKIPVGKLLEEKEWRALGITQTKGWVHYTYHKPEPHILLFRRPLGTDPTTGEKKI
jgi:cyclin-dependent kinase regulatory subunit CKS1